MKILDRLPISEDRTSLRLRDRHVTIHANQILVWVTVHLPGISALEESVPRFPALLDTGNNFGFSLQDRHLRDWAGVDLGMLPVRGDIAIEGKVIPRRDATVWLYSNVSGREIIDETRSPLRLTMRKGIAVYPKEAVPPGPRLPLIGLPALLDNDLDFWLDPAQRKVTVQQSSWRRAAIRLLSRM